MELQKMGPAVVGEHGNCTHSDALPVYAVHALRASAELYWPSGVQS